MNEEGSEELRKEYIKEAKKQGVKADPPKNLEVSHDAALHTDELIEARHKKGRLPKERKKRFWDRFRKKEKKKQPWSQFAEDVGDVAVERAEKVKALEHDQVTGLHRDRIMRKRVTDRLNKGESGSFLVLDIIGLKHLNTFSHQLGDQGLKKTADMLREFNFDELGRKGDEFYCYVSGKTEAEVREEFTKFLQEQHELGNLSVSANNHELELLSYWECSNVNNPDELDYQVEVLDNKVEQIKKNVKNLILKQIEEQPEDQQTELKMLYHNLRRRADEKEIASMFSDTQWTDLKRKYQIKGPKDIVAETVLQQIPRVKRAQFSRFEQKALQDTLQA